MIASTETIASSPARRLDLVAGDLAERAAVAAQREEQDHEVLHAAAEHGSGHEPERAGQVAELRRERRPDERPGAGDRREVVAEHHPAVRRHEVAAVVEPLGGRRPRAVEREHARRDEGRVEAVGDEVRARRPPPRRRARSPARRARARSPRAPRRPRAPQRSTPDSKRDESPKRREYNRGPNSDGYFTGGLGGAMHPPRTRKEAGSPAYHHGHWRATTKALLASACRSGRAWPGRSPRAGSSPRLRRRRPPGSRPRSPSRPTT